MADTPPTNPRPQDSSSHKHSEAPATSAPEAEQQAPGSSGKQQQIPEASEKEQQEPDVSEKQQTTGASEKKGVAGILPLAMDAMAGDHPAGTKLFLMFFLGLFVFSLYLLYLILEPFINSLIFACVLTALCHPLYSCFLRITGHRRPVASFLVLIVLTFLVVLPVYVFIVGLIPQAAQSFEAINKWLGGAHLVELMNTHLQPVLDWVHELVPELDLTPADLQGSIITASRSAGQYLLGAGSFIVSNTLKFIIHFMLVLLVMFFLLIDGAEIIRKIEYYCPLKPRQTGVIMDSMRQISRSVLVGGFAIAALQGIAGGIGFAIVGFPAFFWGTVMIFAALVPFVGTSLVWIPGVIVLIITGEIKSAIFLALWGSIGISAIDSVLRPLLMRGGVDMPIMFIFLAILGGVNVFGMLGLLYGPMILSLVTVMLTIYGEEYHLILRSRPPSRNGSGS